MRKNFSFAINKNISFTVSLFLYIDETSGEDGKKPGGSHLDYELYW